MPGPGAIPLSRNIQAALLVEEHVGYRWVGAIFAILFKRCTPSFSDSYARVHAVNVEISVHVRLLSFLMVFDCGAFGD